MSRRRQALRRGRRCVGHDPRPPADVGRFRPPDARRTTQAAPPDPWPPIPDPRSLIPDP